MKFDIGKKENEVLSTEERIKKRAIKFKNLFYKYSGIEPGTKITEEDINKNDRLAFRLISAYELCSEQELREALLND